MIFTYSDNLSSSLAECTHIEKTVNERCMILSDVDIAEEVVSVIGTNGCGPVMVTSC